MQQYDSMVEIGINKLKEKDDEFVEKTGIIKSITAVYGSFDLNSNWV